MGSAPLWFHCPVGRREQVWTGGYEWDGRRAYRVDTQAHQITRTGRTRANPSRRRTARTLPQAHEFRCSCGHRGWSTNSDVLSKPLDHSGD